MRRRSYVLVIASLAWCCLPAVNSLVRADYVFLRMKDITSNQALQSPSLNDSRQAVYWARDNQSVHTIDLWDRNLGTSTNIVTASRQSTGTINESLSGRPAVNDLGQVAYLRTQSNVSGVTKALEVRNNTVSQTYWTTSANADYNISQISNTGRVVYSETTSAVPSTTTVFTADANGSRQNFGRGSSLPGINAANEIAFTQERQILIGNSPSNLQSIPLTGTMQVQASVAVNDSGKVAFIAADSSLVNSGYNVYTGQAGSAPVMVASADGFGSLSSTLVSINGHGELLFIGTVGVVRGIYSTAKGLDSPIIKVGDSLDGSIVTGLSVSADAFNDFRDIGFLATLQDGRNGVYYGELTAVPEPSASVLFLIGLSWFGFVRCRIRCCG